MTPSAPPSRPLPFDPAVIAKWSDLAEDVGNAFLLPEWYRAAADHYGVPTDSPPPITYGSDGEPVGLVPLTRNGRTIRFVGSGLGDHFHPIAMPGSEDQVAGRAAEMLEEGGYMILDNVEVDARWPDEIQRAAKRPLRRVRFRDDVLPYIDLDGVSWDSYLGAKSSNFRSQVRRKKRRVERDHDAQFRCTETAEELDQDLETFYSLHDARWDPRGGSGMASPKARDFHRQLAADLLERGWLRLWFLELEGEPAATWYGWNVGGRYAYYLGGFAPKWSDQSAGFVLLAHTIEQAIDEGAHTYELLRGDEGYKSRFETGRRRIDTLVLVPASSPMRVAIWLEAELWRRQDDIPERLREVGRDAYSALRKLTPLGRDR